jgi:hypothetical protein
MPLIRFWFRQLPESGRVANEVSRAQRFPLRVLFHLGTERKRGIVQVGNHTDRHIGRGAIEQGVTVRGSVGRVNGPTRAIEVKASGQ